MDDEEDEEEEEVVADKGQDEEESYGGGGGDDDPDAELDEAPPPKPEPSYKMANQMSFYRLCYRMERLWKSKSAKEQQRKTQEEKLMFLLPPKVLAAFNQVEPGQPPESLFPLFRLLMPEKDGSRYFNMKERMLATAYAAAFSFTKDQAEYKQLLHFNDPQVVTSAQGVGDFSVVLESVLQHRICTDASKLTVGDINKYLDDLASLPAKAKTSKSNHDWRENAAAVSPAKKKKKPLTLTQLRADWIHDITFLPHGKSGLSPLEHKWLVRIIQGRLQFGLGWTVLLKWYHPLALTLWTAHNSLKGICNKLCDPDFQQMRGSMQQENGDDAGDDEGRRRLAFYMPGSGVAVEFGTPFEPQCSERTGFDRVLSDVSTRHRENAKNEDGASFAHRHGLAVQHPAFTVETKLDGERMLLHLSRDGIVKIHTRRAKWYSEIYSPVLGPAIRKAVGYLGMDVILDGEILAWDSGRNETIPFGNNRTIAILRRQWMESMGRLEDRDTDQHEDDKEIKSMSVANTFQNKDSEPQYDLAGEECWLQYVAFDIMYLNGPGAAELLEETVSACTRPRPVPGSLLGLDGFERKKLLYRVVDVEKAPHEVEIVKTDVIRPNGKSVPGQEYFSATNPTKECGFPAYTLDSIDCNLSSTIPDLEHLDAERRQGRSNEQISQVRAMKIDAIYKQTVENQRLEGLVFKDLSAPYCLGEPSRSLRYWHKFKPDYFNGSVASDLDLVIIGAYWATGLRDAGKPSSFLCACVDKEDQRLFLPITKVNGNSMDWATLNGLLERTGFSLSPEGRVTCGRWFREKEHGRSLPEFISNRSYQPGCEDSGWRFTKDVYPDLWIHPSNSAVVTLNAGEITLSPAFSAGLTLRFPRITRLREKGDDKMPHSIESDEQMWQKFRDVEDSRCASNGIDPVSLGSPLAQDAGSFSKCRFLTEDQYANKKKEKKRSTRTTVPTGVRSGVDNVEQVSTVLNGKSFVVYQGIYSLASDEIDLAAAHEEGWYDEARSVTNSASVERFIRKHGGIVKLAADEDTLVVGGSPHDAKVVTHVDGVERAASAGVASSAKTQTARKQLWISTRGGVLRWSYVFSLVYRLLQDEREGRAQRLAEKETATKPTVLDYLLRPSKPGSCERGTNVGALAREDLSNHIMMWRAIDIVGKETATGTEADGQDAEDNFNSWQQGAIEFLPPDERWIMSSRKQALWPYSENHDNDDEVCSEVILYPDMYDDGDGVVGPSEVGGAGALSGLDNVSSATRKRRAEKDIIESCLPLVKVMGASVASRIHEGVTHVLCNLSGDNDHFDGLDNVTAQSFLDPVRGQRLLDLLRQHGTHPNGDPVVLVSPKWVRKRKWQGRED